MTDLGSRVIITVASGVNTLTENKFEVTIYAPDAGLVDAEAYGYGDTYLSALADAGRALAELAEWTERRFREQEIELAEAEALANN